MINNFVELVTLIDSLTNIEKNTNTLTIFVLCFVSWYVLRPKKKSNNLDNKDPFYLFGEQYMVEFEKPRLREEDFFAKTGIRANDKDIYKFINLKSILEYKQWCLLRLAQSRIRFEGNSFKVKWNFLDQIILGLLTVLILYFFYVFIWFLNVLIPILIHLVTYDNMDVTGLNLLVFLFIAVSSLLLFFIINVREPLAVYLVRRDCKNISEQD